MSEGERPRTDPPPPAGGRGAGAHPPGVRWERLELRGLAGVTDLDLRFPAGLATLVRPDAWGTSGVVGVLTAVLYGGALEPESERGRHPVGRLTFVGGDGRRYRLERDLTTNEATLAHLGEGHEPASGGGAAAGTHEAVRGAAVAQAVAAAIGVADRESYVQGSCVTRPLPLVEGIGTELQALLLGVGHGTVEVALTRLEEEVRRRTRQGGVVGLREGQSAGELERCEAALQALEQRLEGGRQAADGAQRAMRAVADAEARRAQHAAETERLEDEAALLRRYLGRRRSYQERLDAERAAAQTLARAEELQAEAARAHARAAEVWPELGDAPEDVESRLVALLDAERAESEAARACEAARRAFDRAQEAATRSRRELERFLAGAPFEGEDDGLGSAAVRELRAAAERALADWDGFVRREAAVREARAALKPYAKLALAPEQDRGLLRRYDYEADARVRSLERLEEAVQQARLERRRALVPDAGLPNDIEAEALRAALAAPPKPLRGIMLRALSAAAIGAAVYWLAGYVAGGVGAAVLALVAALGAAMLVRPAPAGRAPRLAGTRSRRFRGLSRGELADLLARYDAWRAQPAPNRRELVRLENEVETAREQLRAFQRRMQPYQEAFPEPGAAYDAFREAQRTVLQREEVHQELCSRAFGLAPAAVAGSSPLALPSPWPRLAAFVEARGGRARSVEELCASLSRLDERAWGEVEVTASTRDEAREAFRAERERLRRAVAVAETILEEREASYTALRGDLSAAQRARQEAAAPLRELLRSVKADAKEVLAGWRQREQACATADRSFDALASLLDAADCESLDALVARVEKRVAESRRERQALAALSAGRDDLPGPEEAYDRARMLDRLEALEERLGFERGARQAAESEAHERTRHLAAFEAEAPVNIAKAEAERDALRARIARLRFEVEALSHAHIALRAAVRDVQAGFRGRLEALASRNLATLTGRPGRAIRLLDDFGIEVRAPEGEPVAPERLGRATRDQLVLALRLAIADHVVDEVRLPLVLDDPFAGWDAERLEPLRGSLERLARERQVVLLSHDARFRDWGEPVSEA